MKKYDFQVVEYCSEADEVCVVMVDAGWTLHSMTATRTAYKDVHGDNATDAAIYLCFVKEEEPTQPHERDGAST